jgi:hypothetical protein
MLQILAVGAASAVVTPEIFSEPLPEPEPVILIPASKLRVRDHRYVPMVFLNGKPVAGLCECDISFRDSAYSRECEVQIEASWSEAASKAAHDRYNRAQITCRIDENSMIQGYGTLSFWLQRVSFDTRSYMPERPGEIMPESSLRQITLTMNWQVRESRLLSIDEFFKQIGHDPNNVFLAMR